MANDTVRPYMNKTVFDELIKVYPDKEEGLNRSVGCFLLLRKLTLRELKGSFSKEELTGIVAAFNGTIIDFTIGISPKDMLLFGMEDAISLEGNDSFYSYEKGSLLRKIKALTDVKAMFLLEEVSRFWNQDSDPDLDSFLEEYVKA